jgi:copper(I)-binding protein
VSPVKVRRTLATVAACVALVSAVTACGFDYPTDRINNVTAGANDRDGTVNVLNAAIVSKEENSGTFVGTFVNNDLAKEIQLASVAGEGLFVGQEDQQPIPIAANGTVDLASGGGIPINGTFHAGQFVPLTFTFDNGETATLDVPVVSDDGQWADLDTSTPSSIPTPSGAASESASASAS